MAEDKGYTGLIQYHGLIQEDPLREFHGQQAYKRFNEMRLNNATIGAGLMAIEYVIRSMSWTFTSEEEEDPWLELVNDSRDKHMTQGWNDFISEALSCVWAGFSIFEKVYQKVDGKWYWRKFSPRGQNTVYRWLFDDKGGLAGVQQMGAPMYKVIDLPIEKLLLFRTKVDKGNPEGQSLLRIAWVSYYYLKNLMQFEGIGFERDVSGMPVIGLPQGADVNEDDENSDASKAAKIVRNIRNDEQAGVVKPFGWEFSLASSSGKSFAELASAIERYEGRIATAFFSQFLLLGQDGVGSMALSENSTDFFLSSVNTLADIISETFTKYAVPQLLRLNGATKEEASRIKLEHTPAANVDIAKIGALLASVKDLLTLDEGDEIWLRQMIGMPERDIEQLKEERGEKEAIKRANAQAFAERVKNTPVDENSVQIFAADPQDMKVRTKREKQMSKETLKYFEGLKRRVLKEAKQTRNRGN